MLKICILIAFVSNCAICSQLESIKHYQSGNENTLDRDLREFFNIIPVDDIRNLTKYFYANDMAMRESYDYLRSAGYKLIVENLSQLTILKKFTNFLNDTGVNLTELKKRLENVVLTSEETESIVGNFLLATTTCCKLFFFSFS
jgi:Insect allergen related repeat, nitrile-specifier detoxification